MAPSTVMSPPSLPTALLLDAGNTLVFLACDVVSEILGELGQPLSAATVEASLAAAHLAYAAELRGGASHEDGWRRFMLALVCSAGVAPESADAAVARLRAEHDRFNLWRRVPPDLPVALRRIRERGVLLAVVSNSEGRLAALLERVGLLQAFDLVVDSALEGVRKPDPEIFWRACRRLDVPPGECLYAGDIPDVDVVGARAAGLGAALIDASGIHPDYAEAPRYASVAELVDRLLSPLNAG